MAAHVTIPIFVPHKGCPFDCIYCNQKKISGRLIEPGVAEMDEIIQRHLSTIEEGTEVEIGFFGGSFTGIDRDYQFLLLDTAYKYVKAGRVGSIRLSTRPDLVDENVICYLKSYGVRTVELGVQSMDDEVLRKSLRGHTAEDVYRASRLIKEGRMGLGIQTMLGLPGDSREKSLATAEKVAGIGPDEVRIYPTLVIKDTALEAMYRQNRYTPLTLEEAVDICSELLELYRKHNIKVIRMGLQPTETISEGGDVVAGPFHPAFGQLVESRLMLKKIDSVLQKTGSAPGRSLFITTPEKNISNIVGQKRSNIEYLKKKYSFSKVVVKVGPPGRGDFDLTVE